MSHATIETVKEIFIVEARSGMYEPSFWSVCAWPTAELAQAQAAHLNTFAKPFWEAMQEFERGYKDNMTDDEIMAYSDGRDALIQKWRDLSGDQCLQGHDETDYFVTVVPFRSMPVIDGVANAKD